jgi:glutathione S-transferase
VYDLYILERSPYCTKTRAMLAYKGVPVRVRSETLRNRYTVLRRRTGSTMVPVLVGEGFALCDSTRIARYLEEEHPEPALHPPDPRRAALGRLIEQLADEWLSRFVLLTRWLDRDTRRVHMHELATELSAGSTLLRLPLERLLPWIFRPTLRAHGAREKNREALRASFQAFLLAAEEILAGSTFLLGTRPTLADFAVYGLLHQMRADERLPHTGAGLGRWMSAMDAVARGEGAPRLVGALSTLERYAPLLALYSETWLRLAIASAEARRAHAREIEVRTGYGPFRARAAEESVGCLKDDLAAIEGALTRARGLLDDPAGEAPLWAELGRLAAGPACDVLRPYPQLWERLVKTRAGGSGQ